MSITYSGPRLRGVYAPSIFKNMTKLFSSHQRMHLFDFQLWNDNHLSQYIYILVLLPCIARAL